jgi:hypothetical protein
MIVAPVHRQRVRFRSDAPTPHWMSGQTKSQEEADVSMTASGLREFIEANHYEYADIGNDCYRLRFSGKNGDYNMFAQAGDDRGLVLVFTYGPVKVPEGRRRMVADYINRVNYGLALGCLEMNPEDGEVRARSSGPVRTDDPPQADQLSPLFDSSFYLMDNWLTGLLRVAFGSETSAVAYAAALEALNSQQGELATTPTEVDRQGCEAEPELTAIEQEVSKLLAERDTEPDSPPASA